MRARYPVLAAILTCMVSPAFAAPIFDPGPYLHAQRLVDVGGRRLNIYCASTGSPAVILDAGLGGSTEVWRLVQSDLAKKTRTCSYDRAGMGFSDPANTPRDASAVVSDLHELLGAAQIPSPYILVGHSIAGLYDRLYADRYRDEVAGMVLVDPAPPGDQKNKEPSLFARCAAAADNAQLRPNSTIFKACGLLTDEELRQKCDVDGPAQCQLDELDNAQARSSVVWKEVDSEFVSYAMSSVEVVREQRNYGNLPLIVLTRGNVDGGWKEWRSAHERIAAFSSLGKDVVVEGSGHGIQIDRPTAVILAIDEVIDQARSGPSNAKAAER